MAKKPNVPEIRLWEDLLSRTVNMTVAWGDYRITRSCPVKDIRGMEENLNYLLEEVGRAIMKEHETRSS